MKIQCSCGVKYAFDITPEMGRTPIQFVCQSCGADSSDLINQLIRQELGVVTEPAPPAAAPLPVAARAGAPAPAPAAMTPTTGGSAPLKVKVHNAALAEVTAAAVPEAQLCLKHAGQVATQHCLVCQKPICPKCMELFGYVCSAFCKAQAENQRRAVPVYEGQRDFAEARAWRKVRHVAFAVTLVVLGLFGFWFWYAWIGSMPRVDYTVKLEAIGRVGQCKLASPDQAVLLRGGLLARHDLKLKKEVWSQSLVDFKDVPAEAAKRVAQMKVEKEKTQKVLDNIESQDHLSADWRIPSADEVADMIEEARANEFELHARGENIWVATPDKLVRHDWQTGKPVKEIPLAGHRLVPRGDELLLLMTRENGAEVVTHLNLVSGETRTEETAAAPAQTNLLASAGAKPAGTKAGVRATNQLARAAKSRGNPMVAATGRPFGEPVGTKPLDPQKLANQAANLPLPEKLALPAVLAAQANQERALKEMQSEVRRPAVELSDDELDEPPGGRLILAGDEFVQFEVKLLEHKTIERQTMKAAPKKSALDGDVNMAATGAIANEILNDIQRDRTGGVTVEDVSRYQATLRAARGGAGWTGELTGFPQLFPLKTVNVVAAKKSLVVLDKNHQKLWESQLAYELGGASGFGEFADGEGVDGKGPCVEHDDSLYVFDQGVLTAFDRATGNVRWRYPSVGISGLFFAEPGLIYVNTSTASPEKLQYSHQIDLSEKIHDVVVKLEAKTGKGLWQTANRGRVAYVAGKFIYTTESYPGDEGPGLMGLQMPPHIRIYRLDSGDGRMLWEHYQKRFPLAVDFQKNTIQLLFKREMQIVKFVSF